MPAHLNPPRFPSFMTACRGAGAGALAAVVLAGCTSVSLDEPQRRPPPPMPYPQQVPPPQSMPPQATPTPAPAPPVAREPQLAAFSTRLDGRNEVPPVYSMGTGTLDAVLDRESGLFRFRLTFSNLSGPVTAAHFHGPADVGGNAPPVVSLNGPYNVPYEGRLTLTPAQRADLLAGRWYINVHTERNPAGELRGQIIERR
ncbi:CHRD domain-containing protein [Xenophilus aerolatus]|nr:CHRD domain-containing protein [Xenophilus aerolatus]